MTQKQADRIYKELRLFKDGENKIETTLDNLIKEFASNQTDDDHPMSKTKHQLLAHREGCCRTIFINPIVGCIKGTVNTCLYVVAAIFIGVVAILCVINLGKLVPYFS
jgi:hypothetical protein